ncbi:Uncharacterised protein [Yersinia nurmii]|uniref:Uncharacterized protein n=1 Tax=Yersinia nurmii TaxID=685706 RepID=A0ABM9S7U2_9GAMM|nr:Uncharacterised protein [Yersinia nurmii]
MGSILCRDADGCLTIVQVVANGWLIKRFFIDGEVWGPIEVNSADEMVILGVKFSERGWLSIKGTIHTDPQVLRRQLSCR